ncbi:hypothetical protein FOMPIDRAFT_1128425 [Fomitopsis schrenkii]|uniref:C2H2-type domain-containing protein n=1 Tax=Fomitopsis schrenkii TaxID=2126942 RepID=S8F7C8_FOMSC|nr:hypothetical protein FOMPIDRAFT_1128425 [Fomitopsis schrenkii]
MVFCWYGNCSGAPIADPSTKSIHRHFVEFHRDDVSTSASGDRTNCKWHSGSSPDRSCGEGLSKYHVIKHVHNVHLKLSVCRCRRCHRGFSRSDSLKRHNANVKCRRKRQ